jgi:hypothetical protein
MQPHLGSVVLCLLLHSMVGSKTLLGFLHDLWVKMYNLCRV